MNTRSRNTVLAQLSALRDEIDNELSCVHANNTRIQAWEVMFAECAVELATMEMREWRKRQSFAT
jgi:hypothetical protein